MSGPLPQYQTIDEAARAPTRFWLFPLWFWTWRSAGTWLLGEAMNREPLKRLSGLRSFVEFEWQRGSSAACKISLWHLSVALIGFGFVASTEGASVRKCDWAANGAVQS